MARSPQYGVELTAEELTTQDPSAVLYGVTPNNTFMPIKIDTSGQIVLGTGLTLNTDNIDIGDVVFKGIDPDASDVEKRIAVQNLGPGNGYSVRTTVFGETGNALKVESTGYINSNVFGNIGLLDTSDIRIDPATEQTLLAIKSKTDSLTFTGTALNVVVNSGDQNLFAQVSAPSGVETTIFSQLLTQNFIISSLVGWGTADAEFLIKVNGSIVGGGWSSPASRTLQISYESAPIRAFIGDTISVTATQYQPSSQTLRINLLGSNV